MQNRQSSKLRKETMRFLDKMLLFTGTKSRPALLETGCMTVYNSCHGEEKRHKRREMNAGSAKKWLSLRAMCAGPILQGGTVL